MLWSHHVHPHAQPQQEMDKPCQFNHIPLLALCFFFLLSCSSVQSQETEPLSSSSSVEYAGSFQDKEEEAPAQWLCGEDGQCHSVPLTALEPQGNFLESSGQEEQSQQEQQQEEESQRHQPPPHQFQHIWKPSVKNNYDPREYVWNPPKNMYTRFTRTYLDFYYREPLVEFNPFIQKDHSSPHQHETMSSKRSLHMKPASYHIPTFEEARRTLPKPIWQGHEDAVACYYKAWEIVNAPPPPNL